MRGLEPTAKQTSRIGVGGGRGCRYRARMLFHDSWTVLEWDCASMGRFPSCGEGTRDERQKESEVNLENLVLRLPSIASTLISFSTVFTAAYNH